MNIGGTKTCCTREEFYNQIEGNILTQCDLTDVGTFYFVYGEVDKTDECKRSRIYLTFYNEAEKVVHTSKVASHIALRRDRFMSRDSCFALTPNAFLFNDCLITLDEAWETSYFHTLSNQLTLELADHLSEQTTVHKTGLARIRETAKTDFTLECDEGHKIEVHRSVMEGLWPLFQRMMSSNMKEVTEKRVRLNMPRTTLEVLVRHLYEERLNLTFMDAANLIVYAQMYELAELLDLATDKVRSVRMDFSQAIYLWRKGSEAQNESVRKYASERIEELMPDVEDNDGRIENLEKAKLVSLFSDVARARTWP